MIERLEGWATAPGAPWFEGEAVLGLRILPSADGDGRAGEASLLLEPLRFERVGLEPHLLPLSPPKERDGTLLARPAESNAPSAMDWLRSDTLMVVRSRLWAPYELGAFGYDPLRILGRRLAELYPEGAEGLRSSLGAEDAARALWVWLEPDLVRFARDDLVRKSCDAARGDPELARFAAFNDLAREVLRFVAPWGMVPAYWGAWLRGEPPKAPAGRIERRIRVPARRRDAWHFRERLMAVMGRAGHCSPEPVSMDAGAADA